MNGEPVKGHPSFIGPHHEVGISPDMEVREVEYRPTKTRSCRGSNGLRITPIALEGALQCLS